jgi:hypothetical protein
MKKLVIILGVIILILLGVLLFVNPVRGPEAPPSGRPAPTSTHQAVFSPDGSIAVTSPAPNGVITSPVTIEGQANGRWYFEASFPIKILDGDGTVLGQGPAQAQSDWMTTGTVPFKTSIAFKTPKYATGTILFEKDNPSGLPQNAGEFRFRVRFK